MNTRPPATLTLTSLAAAAALAAALSSVPPAGAQAPAAPDNPQVKALYAEKCSACHNLPNAQAQGYTRAQWRRTVDRMLTQYHASDSISPAQADQIVEYLATFAPKAGPRRPSDPWATDADDVWTVAPSTTRVFNFEAGPTLTGLSLLAAGAPGPAPFWRVIPDPAQPDGSVVKVRAVKPTPSRFALLVDRADQGRNLDVRVRFQILSGKAQPAVGIAFGFTGPKTYSVLRYNQAANDLALIRIDEPTHTTLQQTAINPPPPPVPGAPSPAPLLAKEGPGEVSPPATPAAPGWHTLRLLVKDGQVRGWLDMTKRISVADPSYNGGKVGLWAQGDTVAVFDDWTIDLYDTPPAPQTPPAS